MTRFYCNNGAASLLAVTATQERSATSGHVPTNAGTVHSVSVAAGSSLLTHAYWTNAEIPHNSLDWPTTGFGASMDVSNVGADTSFGVQLIRVSSDGSSERASSSFSVLSGQSGTGVKVATGATASGMNLAAARAVTDRLLCTLFATNASMMSAQSLDIFYSDSDTWIENTNFTPNQGSGAGTSSWSGTASGQETFLPPGEGSGSGSASWTATATGARVSAGAASGAGTWATTATGRRVTKGSAAGADSWTATAAGKISRFGDARGGTELGFRGDFETDTTGDFVTEGGLSLTWSTDAFTGSRSLRASFPAGGGDGRAYDTGVSIPVNAGDWLSYSFMLKSVHSGGSTAAGIRVRILEDGVVIHTFVVNSASLNRWSRVSSGRWGAVPIPAGSGGVLTAQLGVAIFSNVAYDLYVDDVHIWVAPMQKWTGTAAGEAPGPAGSTASGSHAWSATATGSVLRSASATGASSWTGATSGTTTRQGTGAGAATWSSSALGSRDSRGDSAGAASWTSASSGTRTSSGAATATHTWIAVAPGQEPAYGFAAGTDAWTATASGARTSSGSAAGTDTWTATATGSMSLAGSATGTFTFTGAATSSGGREGAASGAHAWTATSSGTRVCSGTTSGSHVWAAVASGSKLVSGSATGAHDWSASASGARASAGSASGAHAWSAFAPGERPSYGTASGAATWSGQGAGVRASVGAASGDVAWTATASGADPSGGVRQGSASATVTFSGVVSGQNLMMPTGLQAVAVSFSQIDLSWNAAAGATGYDIERDGVLVTAGHTSTTYSDTGLDSLTEYSYRVRARRVG